MSKESNVEKTLHEKVKSITDDLAGQITTLENKYHHKEISFDKYIEMSELYSKLNTEAVEALIASERESARSAYYRLESAVGQAIDDGVFIPIIEDAYDELQTTRKQEKISNE